MAPSLLERQALRVRNGLATVAGLKRPDIEPSPRDLVWRRESARLWRYRSNDRRHSVPILLVHSLVSKSYVLDLLPGNSMVAYLVEEGFDVYLLDWDAARPADAGNTLETYSDHLIPLAIKAACAESGADELTLLGYCYGGLLVLLTAATRPDLPIRNLVTLTTPCDFREMGFMSRMFLDGRLDPEDAVDENGLVPAAIMDLGFQSIKPTDRIVQPVNLWEQLWHSGRTENFLAINGWSRDQLPFPGAIFRQTVEVLIRDNALLTGEVPYNGRIARLRDIKMPYLNVYCEKDTIVASEAAEPLLDLVGSRDKSELHLKSGHVGLIVGRYAKEVARPAIADWTRRHSANRKTSTAKENGDRHSAGAAAR